MAFCINYGCHTNCYIVWCVRKTSGERPRRYAVTAHSIRCVSSPTPEPQSLKPDSSGKSSLQQSWLPQELVAELEVFAATQQGAAAMAAAFQVPYLGRIPLDPSLGRAAELGRSIFDAPKGTQHSGFRASDFGLRVSGKPKQGNQKWCTAYTGLQWYILINAGAAGIGLESAVSGHALLMCGCAHVWLVDRLWTIHL